MRLLPFTEVRNLLILAYALIDVNPCETFDYPGVQIYPSCIQVEVTGSGTAFPISFVSFPGAYTPDTPESFSIYTPTPAFLTPSLDLLFGPETSI
ncbi:hypothetical protein CPB85DRAFT_754777 [Mucidula mucida]|nr:hypothetical protein CPB85DRAFT_754777 [Mucidula mucida]